MPAGEPIVCADCGETFPRKSNFGYRPKRCPECAVQARRRSNQASKKRWEKKNPGAQAKQQREWRARHREKLLQRERERRASRTPEEKRTHRHRAVARRYGLTLEEYEELYRGHRGRCAICGKSDEESGETLNVDHDHDTQAIRGLLCRHCNLALGHFNDDPKLLEAGAEYLRTYAALQVYVKKRKQRKRQE